MTSSSERAKKLRTQLRGGKLDNRLIDMEVREKNFPVIELAGPQGCRRDGHQHERHAGKPVSGAVPSAAR